MFDVGHLPSRAGNGNTQWFMGTSGNNDLDHKIWRRPRGKSVGMFTVVGGGGGGGGGFSAAAGAARGGGGGGGSGAIIRAIFQLDLIPEVLYIQAGVGGQGGAAGAAGTAGLLSLVLVEPRVTALNCLLRSGNAAAAGGGGGTGAAAGALGAAGTIVTTTTQQPLAGSGLFIALAGAAGVAGGSQAGAIGVAQALPVTGIPCMGGAGGAGTTSADFAGGVITAVANSRISDSRPQGAAAGSNDAAGGFMLEDILWSYGGLGGSSSNTGVGGRGGDGGPGSGGGGGGGGTTGGRGGKGGDGFVVITCW